jgi:hypothetical protein
LEVRSSTEALDLPSRRRRQRHCADAGLGFALDRAGGDADHALERAREPASFALKLGLIDDGGPGSSLSG